MIDVERDGRRLGGISFVTRRNKIGARIGHDLFWTHLGGPTLADGLTPDEQRSVITEIVERLPRRVSFRFMCDSGLDYADSLREEMLKAGFSWERHPTFLQHPGDVGVLERMKAKHRTHIKAGLKRLAVTDGTSQEFIDFYASNLVAGSHSPLHLAKAILDKGLQRGRARVFFALNKSGETGLNRIDAAIACAWDEQRYYYWLSRRRIHRPDAPKVDSIATKLLILAAIEHAGQLGLVFDADCPETVGGRALFETVFGFTRIEYRDVYIRRTAITAFYDRSIPGLKRFIKTVFPNAPLKIVDTDGPR
ncbi:MULTISPECIES: hypothetical protein [unclassified Aureimonas]|uniref:hypothetical protein n=1 Tax=unclassified Aureimonas TaxID=2615206 RepID=UPI0006FEDEFB|nr:MULTISPECIES: hypothetical protein [unclassified Aureimonas]KQT60495.1 hypothetical protein ASG62_07570 [Aureimonas sp. Leaf427]KQT79372.1 hypothetical protein ASG54_10170 [Aureimonas sp. Leaf460]